jgi:Peptidase A4 family
MVFAQFQVPTVLNIDPELTQPLITGFWVGIGGFGNNSLLQAGIAATVSPFPGLPFPVPFGSVTYWAWTEWAPNGYIIDNLNFSPGDVVSVLVCAPQPNHGFVLMENLTTSQIVPVGVDPPSTGPNGPSAEWIIESLSVDTPAFTPWTCINCIAGSHDSTLTLTGATTLNMADNEVLTTVTSPSSVTIQWEKYS